MIEYVLYSLLFLYIGFEACHDFSLKYFSLHQRRKKELGYLKEGNTKSYLLYKWKSQVQPLFVALISYKVFVALAMFVIHHHLILDLFHRLNDFDMQAHFEIWTQRGLNIGIVLGALRGYRKSGEAKEL